MISAATGAVALVIAPLVREHGLDYLVATVLLAGVLQIVLSLLGRGQADAVRAAQRHGRLRQRARDPDLHHPAAVPDRACPGWSTRWSPSASLVMVLLPRLTTAVPAPLVAIVLLTAGGGACCGVHVPTVGDEGALPDSLPALFVPDVPLTLETLRIIAPYALAVALVGILESLMTAKLVDDITDTHSDKTPRDVGPGRGQRRHRRCSAAWAAAP